MHEPKPLFSIASFGRLLRTCALPGALILLAAVVIATMARAAAPVANADTYFHLRLGEEFVSGWLPWAPESVTRYATADWIPSQWLSQVVMVGMSSTFGLPGVAWFTGAMLITYVACLYMTTRLRVGPLLAVTLTTIVIISSFASLSGRPQVLSYFFTVLLTSTWLTARRTQKVPWWLIVLMWFWAMVHGMWVIGIAISVVAVAGLIIDIPEIRRHPLGWIAVPVLGVVAAALTPVGPALYSAVFRVGSISDYFAEWAPPDFTNTTTAIAALLVAALVVLLLRTPEVPWFTVAMVLLTCAWLAWSSRTVPIAVAMAAVLLAEQISYRRPTPAVRRFESVTATAIFISALIAMAFIVPHTAADPVDKDNRARASVDALPSGTGLLNEWNHGGTDMWFHPHLDIVMHGYGDMFTDDELERNARLLDLDPGWQDDLDALNVQDALLDREGRLATVLIDLLGWEIVVEDDGLVHLHSPEPTAEPEAG